MLVPLEPPRRDISFGQKERELSSLSSKAASDIKTVIETVDKIMLALKAKEQEFLHYKGENTKVAVNAMNWSSDLYREWDKARGYLIAARNEMNTRQLEKYCTDITKYFG